MRNGASARGTRAARGTKTTSVSCGALRRNVKATRRPERKSFLVIHPSARGLSGEKRAGKLRVRNSAKATTFAGRTDPYGCFNRNDGDEDAAAAAAMAAALHPHNPRARASHSRSESRQDPGVYRQNETLRDREGEADRSPINIRSGRRATS